jgi:DNA-binding NarL/FixJ family response regulator
MVEGRIKVAILAPTLAVRIGIRTLFSGDESIEVVSEAATIEALRNFLDDADVLVFQGSLQVVDWQFKKGIEARLACLWMTDDAQAVHSLRRVPCRAWGVVPEDVAEIELISALFAVNQGFIVAPRRMLDPLGLDSMPVGKGEIVDSLTPRETEVLQLLAQGLANKQIAVELEISEHTVKFHISSIYTKLGVASRIEAVRLGFRYGLIVL